MSVCGFVCVCMGVCVCVCVTYERVRMCVCMCVYVNIEAYLHKFRQFNKTLKQHHLPSFINRR